jgi:hypothetical protein
MSLYGHAPWSLELREEHNTEGAREGADGT